MPMTDIIRDHIKKALNDKRPKQVDVVTTPTIDMEYFSEGSSIENLKAWSLQEDSRLCRKVATSVPGLPRFHQAELKSPYHYESKRETFLTIFTPCKLMEKKRVE